MIALLLRKDPAARAVPLLAFVGLAVGAAFTLTVRALSELASTSPQLAGQLIGAPIMQTVLLCGAAAAPGWGNLRQRLSEHQAALPVHGRDWLLARALALTGLGVVPLAAAALGPALALPAAQLPAFLGLVGACALVWTAWVGACLAWRPAEARLASLPVLLLWTALALGLALLATRWPAATAGLALAGLVLSAETIRRAVPASFEIVPPVRSRSARSAPVRPASARRALRSWIMRRTVLRGRNAVLLAVLALFSAVLWFPSTGLSTYFVFLLVFTAASINLSLQVLREIGPLPIRRRRLAPWILLPPLVAISGTTLVGKALLTRRSALSDPAVDLVPLGGGAAGAQRLRVPAHLWRLGWGRGPLVVRAPWGETAAVDPVPLLPGSPWVLLNPYGVTRDSSMDFVAWQLSRAVHDAYGIEVDPDRLRDDYLSELNGAVISPWFGQKFLEAHPEAEETWHGSPWAAAGIGVLLWFAAAFVALRPGPPPGTPRAWRRARRRRAVLWGAALLLVLAWVSVPFFAPRGVPPLEEVLMARIALRFPGASGAIATLAAALVGGLLLLPRLERVEVRPPVGSPWEKGR